MKIESQELEEYLHSSLVSIKDAVSKAGFRLSDPVEFNLAIINSREGGGGLKIYVANAGGKLKFEEVSHIKITVRPGLGYSISSPTAKKSNPV